MVHEDDVSICLGELVGYLDLYKDITNKLIIDELISLSSSGMGEMTRFYNSFHLAICHPFIVSKLVASVVQWE